QVHVDPAVRVAVRAHLEGERAGGAVQQRGAVEVGRRGDPAQLGLELVGLCGDVRPRVAVVGVVRRLDGQVTHPLQDGVDLGERTLSGLHDRDAVLRVAAGDLETTDLRAQALGDGQTGGVVRGPVD